MLIPFTFRKTKFVLDSYYKNFSILFIENDSSTNWFVKHKFLVYFASINSDRGRSILRKFCYKLVSLILPICYLWSTEDKIQIKIKCFFDLICQPIVIFLFLRRQVYDKFAEYCLVKNLFLFVMFGRHSVKLKLNYKQRSKIKLFIYLF